MSSLRWVVPGFVLGLVISVAPACGPSGEEKCDARTCASGCCTADGRCEPGTQINACGVGAAQCRACGPQDHCSGGLCTPLVFGGTDGGGGSDAGDTDGGTGDGGMDDGGVTCGPSNCSTCCINGVCVTTVNNLTCGAGGNACETCNGPQSCTDGRCINASCSGCVNNAGTCLTTSQQSASQCGTGGTTCTACPSGATCQNGTCSGGSTCNAQTCPSGCCAGNQCMPGTSTSTCGAGGNACTSCSGGQTCQSTGNGGVCQTTAACNAQTCPSGCCNGNTCVTGTSNSACGSGGAACTSCSGGQTCQTTGSGGFCQTTSSSNPVGNACSDDAHCQGGGTFPYGWCYPSTANGQTTDFVGGYCFMECDSDPNICGSTSICLELFKDTAGNVFKDCVKICTGPGTGRADCRAGYACYDVGDPNLGLCLPNCNNPGVGWGCGANQTCMPAGHCQ